MLTRHTQAAVGGFALVLAAGLTTSVVTAADATTPAASTASAPVVARMAAKRPVTVSGKLNTLNNSGVYGKVLIHLRGRKATVRVTAHNLARNLPHAAHIHFATTAIHRCPTNAQDTNGDGRLNVAEGTPAYGDIVKSLTTSGDSSPASALAVDRFPTSPKGEETYKRTIKVKKAVAKAIRRGNAVIVVHGVDYNNNGTYDLGDRGPSEIAPSLPAEATDPAACGKLR